MTPTAMKRLAEVDAPRSRWDLALRVICTGGESLPSEIARWSEEALGAVCNEFYGLTEVNHLVGNCKRLYPIRPGSMGKAYQGRNDDLIKSAGYRIGPTEVEDALVMHPQVAEAAVIGSPDTARGTLVKAFVRLREGASADDKLILELQDFVKQKLALYKYPR